MTAHQLEILRRQFANDPERLKEILGRDALADDASTTPERGITRFDWLMIGLTLPFLAAAVLIAGIYYLIVRTIRRS
ncbi:hypothetical protein [Thiothrix lacustris]|uniref:hypothetical protein n=1 Tax=Thiothrix lacustris TaxID=525917 RepID=UPI00049152B4|nr:hypothetical protein [Thiothrix lacustris]